MAPVSEGVYAPPASKQCSRPRSRYLVVARLADGRRSTSHPTTEGYDQCGALIGAVGIPKGGRSDGGFVRQVNERHEVVLLCGNRPAHRKGLRAPSAGVGPSGPVITTGLVQLGIDQDSML